MGQICAKCFDCSYKVKCECASNPRLDAGLEDIQKRLFRGSLVFTHLGPMCFCRTWGCSSCRWRWGKTSRRRGGGGGGLGSAGLLPQRPDSRMCPAAAAALRTQRVAALRLHEPGEFPKKDMINNRNWWDVIEHKYKSNSVFEKS